MTAHDRLTASAILKAAAVAIIATATATGTTDSHDAGTGRAERIETRRTIRRRRTTARDRELARGILGRAARSLVYMVGEMSNGSAKLLDTHPRGIGRCYVDRPIDPLPGEPWFLDNGVFREWNANDRSPETDYAARYAFFESRLPRAIELAAEGRGPMFVVVPDRPACPRSFRVSVDWIDERGDELDAAGVPMYFAVQDGMTPELLEGEHDPERGLLLNRIAGLFIGGSDDFKTADNVRRWRELADRWGLKLHYGRCTQTRLADAVAVGCDSADSSHPNRLGGAADDPTSRWGRFLEVFDAEVGS